MEFRIRKITKSDANDVAVVHVRSWQSAYRGIISDSFLDSMSIEKQMFFQDSMNTSLL